MQIVSVSQLNTYIKSIIDSDGILRNIWIRGEISNYKHHYSGHMYLSLKDDGGLIRAVMFKGANSSLSFTPENGMTVLARGRVSVYERDGQYQMYIEEMVPDGVGELYLAFEQLKKKLFDEGLFDDSKKRQIPKYPERIGVITSGTGAALQDIKNVLGRRYPLAEVIVYPVTVQGDGAAQDVAGAIKYFCENKAADVLIVGRGGGSAEDLWAFNDEHLARTIYNADIPIISAVGHETDFTICDFVADLRAPTPSAAAEISVPAADELKKELDGMTARLFTLLKSNLEQKKEKLKRASAHPGLTRFSETVDKRRLMLDKAATELVRVAQSGVELKKEAFYGKAQKLNALSPLSVLGRGYTVTEKAGKAVKSTHEISEKDRISIIFSDGRAECEVLSVGEDKNE